MRKTRFLFVLLIFFLVPILFTIGYTVFEKDVEPPVAAHYDAETISEMSGAATDFAKELFTERMTGEKYTLSFTTTEIASAYDERFLVSFEYSEAESNDSIRYCYIVDVGEGIICTLIDEGMDLVLNPA